MEKVRGLPDGHVRIAKAAPVEMLGVLETAAVIVERREGARLNGLALTMPVRLPQRGKAPYRCDVSGMEAEGICEDWVPSREAAITTATTRIARKRRRGHIGQAA
jgi:hypothetical protein